MSKMNKKDLIELQKRTAEQKRRIEELREKLATHRAARGSWGGRGGGTNGGTGGMSTTYAISSSTSAPLGGGGPQWNNYTYGPNGGYGQWTFDSTTSTPCTLCGCAVLDHALHETWHAEIQKVATEQAVTELQEMIQDIIELSAPE